MSFKFFFVSWRAAPTAPVRRVRAASTGRPFTRGGYAVVAFAVAGLMLAALISVGSASDALYSALPLSSLFG